MSKEEIKERNEAIAAYMGFRFVEKDELPDIKHNAGWLEGNSIHTCLNYEVKWDWLMLVVEKINRDVYQAGEEIIEHCCVSIFYNAACIDKKSEHFSMRYLRRENGRTLLENVWLVVSDYCLTKLPR